MTELNQQSPSMGEIILYQDPDGSTQVDVKFDKETVWLSQEQIALLFKRDRTVITRHVNNIFKEGELEKKSNVQILHIPNSDKPVVFYKWILSSLYDIVSNHT